MPETKTLLGPRLQLRFTTVIGDPLPQNRTHAIIFNMWNRDDLGSESACAFLRHAFGCFYNAFSKVDLELKLFSTPLVFHKTLLSFRSAVLRYAQTIRILYLQRRYTTLRTKLPPKESRDRFKALVVIQETFYDFELTAAFTRAISDTETAVTAHYHTEPNPEARMHARHAADTCIPSLRGETDPRLTRPPQSDVL